MEEDDGLLGWSHSLTQDVQCAAPLALIHSISWYGETAASINYDESLELTFFFKENCKNLILHQRKHGQWISQFHPECRWAGVG